MNSPTNTYISLTGLVLSRVFLYIFCFVGKTCQQLGVPFLIAIGNYLVIGEWVFPANMIPMFVSKLADAARALKAKGGIPHPSLYAWYRRPFSKRYLRLDFSFVKGVKRSAAKVIILVYRSR